MNAIRHILVCTDFGEPASAALDYATDLAERFGARITLLHVAPLAVPVYGAGVYWPPDDLRSDVEKALNAAAATARHRWELITTELTEGHPAESIVAVAAQRGVDLIVMGTHGRRGLRRLALGSVAEHVVRYADVPVLTVRAAPKAKSVSLDEGDAGREAARPA